MRSAAAMLLLLVGLGAARAQEPAQTTTREPAQTTTQTPPKPDYSKQTLVRIFADDVAKKDSEQRIEWGFGSVEFKALGMRWRINYIPMMMPLPGSVPTTHGLPIPDALALSGTQAPYTARTWNAGRPLSQEMRRIERLERERAKERSTVAAQPQ